jgi:hypothetical protein
MRTLLLVGNAEEARLLTLAYGDKEVFQAAQPGAALLGYQFDLIIMTKEADHAIAALPYGQGWLEDEVMIKLAPDGKFIST